MLMIILDVGQCGVDGPAMERLFRDELDAEVIGADTADEAKEQLDDGKIDVVLVNRVLAVDGSSGVALIKSLMKAGCKCPVMLVSDRDDAQEQAQAAGAMRGFGKSQLSDAETLDLIRQAVKGKKS